MEFNQIETCIEERKNGEIRSFGNDLDFMPISIEAEIPEALYVGKKDFIRSNEK